MNNNDIKFSDKKRVVDIKSLNAEELYEIKTRTYDDLCKLKSKSNDYSENTSKLIAAAIVISLAHTASHLLGGPPKTPSAVNATAILDGILIALPTLSKIIGNKVYKIKCKKKKEEVDVLDDQYNVAHTKEVMEIKREEASKHIEVLKDQLSKEYALDDFEMRTKERCEKELIDGGIDEKIIEMPGIQKIFDAVLFPTDTDYAHRMYSNETGVKEDGSFVISAFLTVKEKSGFPKFRSVQTFNINYSDDGNPEHYLTAKDEKGCNVYINKEGRIVELEQVCRYDGGISTVSVPYEDKNVMVR